MNAAATRAAKRLQKWPVQELVNTAWCSAKLAPWRSPSWQAATRVAREPWPRFVAQDPSTLARAPSAAARCGSSALAALGRALLHADAAPQHLALVARASAVAAPRGEPLLGAAAAEAIAQVAAFGSGPAAPCQDLALVFWAPTTLGMCRIPLLDALSEASERKLPQLNPQNLANAARCPAALQALLPPLMHAIGGRAVELFDEFGPQEAANTA
ncbi:unnamed protein product [Effrenium voratum]|nr:unnamed protein product [Effrenium voratum]